MQPVITINQHNFSDTAQAPQQNQTQEPSSGWFDGWGYRDIAMFSGQGISGLGALVTYALGGLNTAAKTPPVTNTTTSPPSPLTTGNSYVLIGFGILFTIGTVIQIGTHYHWRNDRQNAKNKSLKSLGEELEKDLQDFQVIVERTEEIRKKIGAISQSPIIATQALPAEEKKPLPDHKTTPQVDDQSDASVKITVKA